MPQASKLIILLPALFPDFFIPANQLYAYALFSTQIKFIDHLPSPVLDLLLYPALSRSIGQMQAPHEDLSLPLGTNMHASASSTQQRRPSVQSRRLSSTRSGNSGHVLSSRHSVSSANARNAARETSQQQHLQQQQLRRASLSASTQSSSSKWWRIHFFRGMMNDVKRRAPYYWSDWTDAWDYRIVPATVYMYFAKYVLSFFCLQILFFFFLQTLGH
jgi:hypothetical protein